MKVSIILKTQPFHWVLKSLIYRLKYSSSKKSIIDCHHRKKSNKMYMKFIIAMSIFLFQAVQSGSVVSQPGLLTKSQQHSVFGFPVQSLSVKMSQQQLVSSFKHALSIVGGMGIIAVKKEIKILRNFHIL